MSDCGDIHNCSACWAKHEAEREFIALMREQEAFLCPKDYVLPKAEDWPVGPDPIQPPDNGTFFMGGRL